MLYPSDEERIKKLANELQIKWHKGWQNFSRTRKLPQTLVLDIPNHEALQALIKKINVFNQTRTPKSKITYRAAAGGEKQHAAENYSESFSFSPCAEADVILRLTGPEFENIKVDVETETVKVGAGIQVGYLDKVLYEQHRLVLPTSSLFGYPTTVGLAANAGHGTGPWDSFAGLVTGLTICRPDGEIVELDWGHEDFRTIRAGHLGLLGIVLNQTIQCIPAKKLHCEMDATTIEKLLPQLHADIFNQHDYVSIMYVPTGRSSKSERTKKDNVLIFKSDAVPLDTPDKNHCPVLDYVSQDLSIRLQEAFEIPEILVQYPNLIPNYMRYLVSGISVGKDRDRTGPWHELMHYQTAFPWKIDDADYLFQVSPGNREIMLALNFVVDKLSEYAKKGLYPVTYAIYIRMFGGTNGGLSTSEHQPGKAVCGFDIVSDPSVPGYAAFKQEVQQFFIERLKARPHWGKSVPMDVDYEAMYGANWHQFKQVLERWYQASGTTLPMSPLMTPFFAQILKVPEVTASTSALLPKGSQRLFSPVKDRKERIAALVAKIEDDGGYGTKLRRGFR